MRDWQGTIEFAVWLFVMLVAIVVAIVASLALITNAYMGSLEENPCPVTNQK